MIVHNYRPWQFHRTSNWENPSSGYRDMGSQVWQPPPNRPPGPWRQYPSSPEGWGVKSSIWSWFEIKNWIEYQFQASPKLVGIWTVLRRIFVPNLEIVTSIGGELWHGQAQNGVNFDFEVKFDLECQGISPPKTVGILTKVFYIYGPTLVILA